MQSKTIIMKINCISLFEIKNYNFSITTYEVANILTFLKRVVRKYYFQCLMYVTSYCHKW